MGRVYASWAMSQAFYRERLYRTFGAETIEDYVVRFWEGNFLRRDPNDLMAQFDTWLASDVSANRLYQGDLAAALGAVTARSMIMPSSTDLYFTVADSEIETAMIGEEYEALIPRIPMHRMGRPDEVASAVFRLCTEDFGYVTGTEIFVTGGQHL